MFPRQFNQDSYPYFNQQDSDYEFENHLDSNQQNGDLDECDSNQFEENSQEMIYTIGNHQQRRKYLEDDIDQKSTEISDNNSKKDQKSLFPNTEELKRVRTKKVGKKQLIPQTNTTIQKKIQSKGLTTQGKNNAKNICRTLKSYIFTNFDKDQRQIEPLKRFLALKPENCGKIRLESFLKNKKGNAIGQVFFGNYQWARLFSETNKIDVGNQVQYNEYWYNFTKQNQI